MAERNAREFRQYQEDSQYIEAKSAERLEQALAALQKALLPNGPTAISVAHFRRAAIAADEMRVAFLSLKSRLTSR